MKRGLLILVALVVASSVFAFTAGTINPGGTVSFSSYKSNADEKPTTMLLFSPQVGYFVIDNLSLDLALQFSSENQAAGDFNSKYSSTGMALGLGGRYFYQNFYGGLALMYSSSSYESGNFDGGVTATYFNVMAGYLVPIAENVYIDLGLDFAKGFGNYGGKSYDNGPDVKNEMSDIGFNAGFQIFFPIR